MPEFPIQFIRPAALWLLLLAVPIIWWGVTRLTGMGPWRRRIVIGIRLLLLALLVGTLAQPRWMERGDGLTVVLLIDRSKSISPQLESAALDYLSQATDSGRGRRPIDRLAIVNIGGDSRITVMPDTTSVFDPGLTVLNRDATNLAAGLELGMAIAPADTATRFVLASDGNENVDSITAAADVARSNGQPIDVLPLEFDLTNEVLFERIVAPATARRGQNIALKMIIRAQAPTTGTLTLRRGGEIFDLDPESDASGVRLELKPGVNTHLVTLNMDEQGPQRFEAYFEPDPGQEGVDSISTNNQYEAVVVVGGEGKVLIIDESGLESAALRQALTEARIEVDLRSPHEISADLLDLSVYDSIIMANVPAHAFGTRTHEALRRYVHDIGGGLVVLGGPDALGAGGWVNTELEKALPVRLDPPDMRQMPRGALVCIMHSTEIPQGNYWGQQCAIGAINALASLDLAGVIDFDWNRGGDGVGWVFPLQPVGDKTAAANAVRKMTMGDMPDFAPSMRLALDALKTAPAGQKHVIIISDGDPSDPPSAMINEFVQAGITISTVIAGGHGNPMDNQRMQAIAQATGGEYHNPTNPSQMPQIFIKTALTVRRSLIVEGEVYGLAHQLSGRPGPFNRTLTALPPVTGYILTAPRPGYTPEIMSARGDPVMAHWQYGLGKSVVFASDVATRWGTEWAAWGGFAQFWEQVVRWTMRSSTPSNLLMTTQVEGDRVIVDVEALTPEGDFANFGTVEGVMVRPDLNAESLNLQQTGPGRWRGEFRTDEPGSHVINLTRTAPDGEQSAVQGGVPVPYSMEYRVLRDNRRLLETLAERTGGRVLPSDPALADLFQREGLVTPRSMTDLWTLAAIAAAVVFLLDVGTRRLAIDVPALSAALRSMLGGRASTAGSGLTQLKTTRESVQAQVAQRVKAAKSARFSAEESAGPSLDLDDEAGGDDAGRIRKDSPAESKPEAPPEAEDSSPTSRLLEAKRRALKKPEDPRNPS